MNFLAHLHLASLAQSSLVGNLAADFIRGNPYATYSAEIADGVMLHRRIDKLVDSLPEIKACRHLFSSSHFRVAPIVLDVIWDHFLARDWLVINDNSSLNQFMQHIEPQISHHLESMPDAFQQMHPYLWRERWLERYADLDFIEQVLQRMAIRRPKLFALASAFSDIKPNYLELERVFNQFYPVLMAQAQAQQL